MWHAYQKTFLVKCEGCGLGFEDIFGKRAHTNRCSEWQAWKKAKDEVEKIFPCPSCGELMRGPQFGLHVNSCKGPWTPGDWEKWRTQRSFGREGKFLRDSQGLVLSGHLANKHGMNTTEYKYRFGNAATSGKTMSQRRKTNIENFGYPTALQNPDISKRAEAKRKATCQKRYGNDGPVLRGENFKRSLRKNHLESKVEMLCPENVVYVGNSQYWIQCKDACGKRVNRNPDFVVYSKDQLPLGVGVSPNTVRTHRIIEVLGNYFHGKGITGLSKEDYEKMRIAEYKTVKVQCLLLWEVNIKKDPEKIRKKIAKFAAEEADLLD
ncbi:MAG: hypothetical protein WC824_13065 [Bacteroidota bacterium]